MTVKDLTAYLSPNLELPWNGVTFVVPPPSRETGAILTAINLAGVAAYTSATGESCAACGRSGTVELSEKVQDLVRAAEDKDLGELSLGPAYQQMLDAGVPAPDLELFELYALYYWTMGEDVADQIISARHKTRHGGQSSPKAPARRKSGRASA
ncbi:MAG: hypothetical protein Q4F67_12180 [Propionibacteriaceae bacterium]|nr:hypothetical protein [Propionibacteriaceae bacterium]